MGCDMGWLDVVESRKDGRLRDRVRRCAPSVALQIGFDSGTVSRRSGCGIVKLY